ncbi:Scp-like extracellular protein, partial [Globisporangium splendens]
MPSTLPWKLLIVVASCAAALTNSGFGVVAKVREQQLVDRNLQTYSATDKYQTTMLAAVNAERAKQGLAPFCTSKELQAAAQLHSDDQATNNFVGHTGSKGSKMSQCITAQDFIWSGIAAVVAAWMASAGHRKNILGTYTFFGMGYGCNTNSKYKRYWTQNFGRGDKEACD